MLQKTHGIKALGNYLATQYSIEHFFFEYSKSSMIIKNMQQIRIPLNSEDSLEAVFSTTTKPDFQNPKIAILCHPHPKGGGTIHSKVVTAMDRAYLSVGIDTLKFQFRGSGGSSGEFTDGQLEDQDVGIVSQYMHQHFSKQEFFYAGFSFGSAMAYKFVTQDYQGLYSSKCTQKPSYSHSSPSG